MIDYAAREFSDKRSKDRAAYRHMKSIYIPMNSKLDTTKWLVIG